MSTRSLLEINHDFLVDILDNPEKVKQLRLALSVGGYGRDYPLPTGIKFLGARHHSDPEFMSYGDQLDIQRAYDRLRAGKRVVRKKLPSGRESK